MENNTSFNFMLFENLGYIRYALFILGFVLYFAIILFNVLIMLAVFRERTLHQPMYILISCLSMNSLFGTAGFFPRVLSDLLSETHSISREACFFQSFVIFTYAANEFTILMLMAFDRFAAICKPLRYHSIVRPRFLACLIVINLTFPMILLGVSALLTTKLKMCGNKLFKVYCHSYEVVKLSCDNIAINNAFGLFIVIITTIIPISSILFSYVKILIICQRSSAQLKGKAYQTCIPHIVVLLNFTIAVTCDVTLSRVANLQIPVGLSVFLSLEFLIIPPVLNPLIYAFNLPDIRKKMVSLIKPLR
ncbi:odorant receptor 128-2 [Danio rerio]|uniref:Odorant receptor n=1 Tax=Danio rerio TaxID=7955 RepID=Q2PRG3_DANRE|nr:odorant receptor 128-2 [Danio rerio]ABC43304.1 odorant receptor [Danio rerio]|eukprot:NP_001121847.1 odorant receptor, family E, subfamily 128, member 2 [Danio rerio]